MDEASKLVGDLLGKLAELDYKVSMYRRDMATEFEKYAEGLLRDVPKDISETVSKILAESMKDYKFMCPDPDASEANESSVTGNSSPAASSYKDTEPAPVRTSMNSLPYGLLDDETEEDVRSPHEREKEFQGLFTPSYLPLLDSHDRRLSTPPLIPPLIEQRSRQMDTRDIDADTDTRSLATTPKLIKPPTPKRRNTDETSIASDVSDGPIRRSALRRSSSSSKTYSPRRVRFDVEGEEVLPTASPLAPPTMLQTGIPTASMDTSSDDEEAGSFQVENIEDSAPPKRISSSQALRALSRNPIGDDGTTWTTVSAPPDGSPSVATSIDGSKELSIGSVPAIGDIMCSDSGVKEAPLESNGQTRGIYQNEDTPNEIIEGQEGIFGGEGVEISGTTTKKEAKTHVPISILSPAIPANIEANKSPTASTRPLGAKWQKFETIGGQTDKDIGKGLRFADDEDDELFQFDENNEQRSPPEEPEDDTDDTASTISPTDHAGSSLYPQKSIARQINQTANPSQPNPTSEAVPSKAAIGSYKGHPFNMPIVSDEIHAQAASLGAMNSFVGSVNGRSGLDESDVQSFRASVGMGSFSGTPRSMSERMMMDDIKEAEEARKAV